MGMGIPIGEDTLYTLLFADDQADADDANYMLRKLKEEYVKWGLIIILAKIEYFILGESEGEDLQFENG